MTRCKAVIGAGYGDEGKGTIVNQLCADEGMDLVVRHSGGANAGHTVVVSEDDELFTHVFHHFGAGTLTQTETFLGRRFISNPILFRKERKRLHTLINLLERISLSEDDDVQEVELPMVWADPRGLVTTPLDMLLNEMREEKLRHGSTGAGINETIERSMVPECMITVQDTRRHGGEILEEIYRYNQRFWVPERMKVLGLTPEDDPRRWEYLNSDTIRDNWIADAIAFGKQVEAEMPHEVFRNKTDIVFEGSQGLLLDEKHGFFPHVTRARTGLVNVMEMINEIDDSDVYLDAVHWVTRSYMTRHGNGPFPTEGLQEARVLALPKDTTNKTGPWQGELRYGGLDLALMSQAIEADLREVKQSDNEDLSRFVAVTWLDGMSHAEGEKFAANVAKQLNCDTYYGTFGPDPTEHITIF